jgi:hypothetical protein
MEKVPLSPVKKGSEEHVAKEPESAWRLHFSDLRMPERPQEQPLVKRVFKRGHGAYLFFKLLSPILIIYLLMFSDSCNFENFYMLIFWVKLAMLKYFISEILAVSRHDTIHI